MVRWICNIPECVAAAGHQNSSANPGAVVSETALTSKDFREQHFLEFLLRPLSILPTIKSFYFLQSYRQDGETMATKSAPPPRMS